MSKELNEQTKIMGISSPILINKNHDFSDFDCGEPALNEFAKKDAFEQYQNNESSTYVLTLADSNKVIGFFTLAHYSVRTSKVSELVPGQYSATRLILLGRLAVDKLYQKQGLGEDLTSYALELCYETSKLLKFKGVGVHPKNEKLLQFYSKFGFLETPIDGLMILLMDKLVDSMNKEDR